MDIHAIYSFFMNRFRPARAKAIGARFPLLNNPEARALDVGGGGYPWDLLNPAAHITILNMSRPHTVPENTKWEFVIGDGTNLQYPDQSFDLVFSNSVIEHVGDFETQSRFAKEMLRVGKNIYCQTPNKWFPIEPHLIAAFIHWFPYPIARKLVRYGCIWGLVTKPSQQRIDEFLSTTRLLTLNEFKQLYPDCKIHLERFFGLTKSFIAERVLK
jgi:SAM-dependent methyltransferase